MENKSYIFLDIDGVLRPFLGYHPKGIKEANLGEYFSEKYHDSRYLSIDSGTLYGVTYDFHPEAIQTLHNVIQKKDADIVLTTSWRSFHSMEDMKLLFQIHDLDRIIDKTPYIGSRSEDIKNFLEEHPKIEHYVIIDDIPLKSIFPHHAVTTKQYLKASDEVEILQLLKNPRDY